MQLTDYAEFAEFKNLREKMQADKNGIFELFDPNKHLTGEDRAKLEKGIKLDFSQIILMRDHSLRYKNSRIMLWSPSDNSHYHLTDCEILQKAKNLETDNDQIFLAFSQINGLVPCLIATESELNAKTDLEQNKTTDENKATELEFSESAQQTTNWKLGQRDLNVCKHCLQKLHFKGFDMYNNRHFAYSEELWLNFSRTEFSKEYKIYPLTEDMR